MMTAITTPSIRLTVRSIAWRRSNMRGTAVDRQKLINAPAAKVARVVAAYAAKSGEDAAAA